MNQYGKLLKQLIKDAKYKQCEIAEVFGMSEALMSKVLCGDRKAFDEFTTISMVRYLTTSDDRLIEVLTAQAEEKCFVEFVDTLVTPTAWKAVVNLRNQSALKKISNDQWERINEIASENRANESTVKRNTEATA